MIKILAAVFLPPLGVFLQSGIGKRFYINCILTLFGVIPGVLHAIWGLAEERTGFRLDRLLRRA